MDRSTRAKVLVGNDLENCADHWKDFSGSVRSGVKLSHRQEPIQAVVVEEGFLPLDMSMRKWILSRNEIVVRLAFGLKLPDRMVSSVSGGKTNDGDRESFVGTRVEGRLINVDDV